MADALAAVDAMARIMVADTNALATELRIPLLRALRFKLDVTAALLALTREGAAHV
jgi:hypothetical protein